MSNTLTRRSFFKCAAGTLAVSCACSTVLAAPSNPKPNFLWISCEDLSPHLGCFGDKNAITPNLDRFAKESVRYTNAFTVAPVCAPSRNGIITAMYPSTLGSTPMRSTAIMPEFVKFFPEYLRQAGYYCTNNSKEDYNTKTPKTVWDVSSKQAHWKNRPDKKPFFAVFNFTGTHESQIWNSADFDNTHPKTLKPQEYQKPEKMIVPPYYPDTLAVRRDLARVQERATELDYFFKDRLDELKESGFYDDTIIFFWPDHGDGLARSKRYQYDSGLRIPLMVRIPEKFRVAKQGTPNSVDDRLINMIDMGPTLLNLAGLPKPDYMQGQPFLGDNLGPARDTVFTVGDRMSDRMNMNRSVRDKQYRYTRNFYPNIPYYPHVSYGERCNCLKELRRLAAEGALPPLAAQYMTDRRPAEELFDSENDPYEVHNLAGDEKYNSIQQRLRQALDEWMLAARDTAFLAEPEMKDRAKQFGSEYAIFHQPDSEALVKQLLRIATLSTCPKDSDRELLYQSLADEESGVRYWAVLGLGNLPKQSPQDLDKVIIAAEDKNFCVRMAAAEVLIGWKDYQKALDILLPELKAEQSDDNTLLALEILTHMGAHGKPAQEAVNILEKAKSGNTEIPRLIEYFNEQIK